MEEGNKNSHTPLLTKGGYNVGALY